MASSSKHRSRKRRNPAAQPRAVPSTRREEREAKVAAGARQAIAERRAGTGRDDRRRPGALGSLGKVGERPESPFGGFPASEIAIFVGIVGIVVGFINGGGPALIVGVIAVALGVLEGTFREHITGYRSHTWLLAAVPAVAVEVLAVILVGQPKQHALVLVPVVPVFLVAFWLLRRRFRGARQRRLARL